MSHARVKIDTKLLVDCFFSIKSCERIQLSYVA